MNLTVAIDGGTRTGKTSTARRVANQLGLPHICTGLVYRTLAWLVQENQLDPTSALRCAWAARQLARSDFAFVDGDTVRVGDRLLGPQVLRLPEVEANSSVVAKHAKARGILLALQRQAASEGAVVEGRDIGTVVLPNADLKFFLTVSQAEHQRRAQKQGGDPQADAKRDLRETTRRVAPLMAAADAIVIDTTELSVDEVAEQILGKVPYYQARA